MADATNANVEALIEQGALAAAARLILTLMLRELGYDGDLRNRSLTVRELARRDGRPALRKAAWIVERIHYAGEQPTPATIDALLSLRREAPAQVGAGAA